MLLIAVIMLCCVSVMSQSDIRGLPQTCSNEGEAVDVGTIKGSTCFTCKCKNGFVECLPGGCPPTDGCYHLVKKPKNGCCDKCKSCIYNGKEYQSGTEWTDPKEPCHVFRCEANVITESELECYTPCDRPMLPRPGQCCGTCPGCRINGQRVTEERERDVTLQEDPCLKCQCDGGRLMCSKRPCPVLHCSKVQQYTRPGECCPRCMGSRERMTVASKCILGTSFLTSGTQINFDRCTNCTCLNGTSLCKRPTCPVLECLPEHQKTTPGECCPHCPLVEEVKTTCSYAGRAYEDGSTWELDSCKSCRCHQGKIKCFMVRCDQNKSCPPNHKLVNISGQCCPQCVESDGVCTVFGDPHYKTFDGKFYSFQGSCKYQLTADCVEHSFSIRVTNDARQTKSSAWTKTISIKIKDLKINLGQKKRVKVNGERVVIPHSIKGKVDIEKVEDTLVVSTHIGIKVLWDGNSFLEISAPIKYKNRLCGLCGNFNSNVTDDWKSRHGRLYTDNSDISKFGASWRVGGKKACARQHENMRKEGFCLRNKKRHELLCLPLKYGNSFGNCEEKVNHLKYFKACMMDMCECPTGNCFCEAFTAYAHECQRLGVKLPDWRALTNCRNNSSFVMPHLSIRRKSQIKPKLNPPIERPKNPIIDIRSRGPPPPLN